MTATIYAPIQLHLRDVGRYRATSLSKPRTYLFLKNNCTSDNLHVEGHKVNWLSFSQNRKREAKHIIFLIFGVHVIYMLDGNNERQRKEKIVLVKLQLLAYDKEQDFTASWTKVKGVNYVWKNALELNVTPSMDVTTFSFFTSLYIMII